MVDTKNKSMIRLTNGNFWPSSFFFPLLVASLLKWLLLRAGGLRFYRAGLPFFIGLAVVVVLAGAGYVVVRRSLRPLTEVCG